MHKSKSKYGQEPNRIEQVLYAYGINNKQDTSTLDLKKGEIATAINIDLSNTQSSRNGYTSSQLPTTYTARSDNRFVFINGTLVTGSDLGTGFVSKPYKLPMINNPNEFLEFYNGRIYALVSSGNTSTLYCSDPWSASTMDERICIVDNFDSVGKFIGRTDDGLVIGTDTEIVFLQGKDPLDGGFTRIVVALYGGITNTLCRVNGDKIEHEQIKGRTSVFTTPQGICAVGTGGYFINFSMDTTAFKYSENACAFIKEREGQVWYIVSFRGQTEKEYNDEVDLITITDSN